jgi:hypothetical protein
LRGDHQLATELAQIALRAAAGSEDARLLKAAALRAPIGTAVNDIANSSVEQWRAPPDPSASRPPDTRTRRIAQ